MRTTCLEKLPFGHSDLGFPKEVITVEIQGVNPPGGMRLLRREREGRGDREGGKKVGVGGREGGGRRGERERERSRK